MPLLSTAYIRCPQTFKRDSTVFTDHGYIIADFHLISASESFTGLEEIDLQLENFLVASSTVSLKDSLRAMYYMDGRIVKRHILYDNVYQILQPLSSSPHWGLAAHVFKTLSFSYPFIAFHYCSTSERNVMSSVRLDYSCIRRLQGKDEAAAWVRHECHE